MADQTFEVAQFGEQGPPGAPSTVPGPTGPAGVGNTTLLADYALPNVGQLAVANVATTAAMVPGQVVAIDQIGALQVIGVVDPTHVNLKNLGYPGNASPGTVAPASSLVAPSGKQGPAGPTGADGAQGPPGPAGTADLGSPAVVGQLPFSTAVPGVVQWRYWTTDDSRPGISATFTGGSTVEMGTNVSAGLAMAWTASATPVSVVYTDSLGNGPIDVTSTPSFHAPAMHPTTLTTITMTLTFTFAGGITKVLTQALNSFPEVFWGAGPQNVHSQADAEALTGGSTAITNTRARTITVNVGAGETLKYYVDKLLGQPTFLFGAIPTDFTFFTVTFTRQGQTRDYWCCESPTANTASTTVTAQ